MSQMMARHAEDDMDAIQISNGMLSAGARVVSVVGNGTATHFGAMAPHMRFLVFAEVQDHAHVQRVDYAITHARRQ